MSNEPVAINGGLAVILALVAPLLARYGIDTNGAAQVIALVGSVVSGAVAIWRIVAARSKVTPVTPPSIGTTGPPAG